MLVSPLRRDGTRMLGPLLGMGPCCKWQNVVDEPPTLFSPKGALSPCACSDAKLADVGMPQQCRLCGAWSRCAPAEPHRPCAAPPSSLGETMVEHAFCGSAAGHPPHGTRPSTCFSRASAKSGAGLGQVRCWRSRLPTLSSFVAMPGTPPPGLRKATSGTSARARQLTAKARSSGAAGSSKSNL